MTNLAKMLVKSLYYLNQIYIITQYHNFILLLCINIFIENSKKKKKKRTSKNDFPSSKIEFKIYSIFMNNANDYKML